MGIISQQMAPSQAAQPTAAPAPPAAQKSLFDGIFDLTSPNTHFIKKPWRGGVNPQTLIPSAAHALALVTSGSV